MSVVADVELNLIRDLIYFNKNLLKNIDFIILFQYNKYRKWRNHKRGFAKKMCKLTSTRQSTDVSFFYLCSCLSTQFLYRTAVKATFNVKDNINDIIKNSITLTINITTFPTKIRKIGGKNHICLFSFSMLVSIA